MATNIVPSHDEEEISFQMRVKSTPRILVQQWAVRLGLPAFVFVPPVGFYWIATYGGKWPFNPVAAIISVIMLVGLLRLVMEATTDTKDGLPFENEWLDQCYCSELANLCEEYHELSAYRDLVITRGRRFTRGEFNAMKEWPEVKTRIAAARRRERIEVGECRRLYKLADQ